MKSGATFSANSAVEDRKEKDSQFHADAYSNYPVQINTDVCYPFVLTGSLSYNKGFNLMGEGDQHFFSHLLI